MPTNRIQAFFQRTDPRFFLVVIPLILYSQVLFFDKNIDDFLVLDPVIGKINHFSDLAVLLRQPFNQVDYRPIPILSFGLEQLLAGGFHPGLSHAVNLVLFCAILLSAWSLLIRLLGPGQQRTVFWALLLFACSPLNAEVVCSIKSRDTLLSLLFSLLGMRCFLGPLLARNALRYLAGAALLLTGLFSKWDSLGLVLFLPLYVLAGVREPWPKKLLHIVLFAALAVVLHNTRYYVGAEFTVITPEAESIGRVQFTENPIVADFSLPNRVAAACQTNLVYLGKFLLPYDLRYYYGFDHIRLHGFDEAAGWILAALNLLLALLILFVSRKQKLLLPVLGAYFATLLFALNLAKPIAGIVADRYAFQAGIWFWTGLVLLLGQLPESLGTRLKSTGFKGLPWLIVIIYAGFCTVRASAWKHPLTLLERDVPALENSFESMRMAASLYKEASDTALSPDRQKAYLQLAIACAEKANRIYPERASMRRFTGGLYFANGQPEKAETELLTALQLDSSDVLSLNYLGDIRYAQKDLANAAAYYEKALGLRPGDATLINNLSTVYYESGDKARCLNFNEQLIASDPANMAAWENLGYFYLSEGDTAKAREHFGKAVNYGLDASSVPVLPFPVPQ